LNIWEGSGSMVTNAWNTTVKFASQVLKETKVCLGSSNDLPYRVMREDYTATYSYEPVARLPVPYQAARPSAP